MSVLSNQKVSVAQVNRSKLDVSSTHVTTGNFMQAQPVYYRHMLPKERLRGNITLNCRLAPLAVPTYGRARINVRQFFVPFRVIFPNFNDFIADTIANNFNHSSLVDSSPVFANSEILDLFINGGDDANHPYMSVVDLVANPNAAYDVSANINGVTTYHKFTTIGREMYKTFLSLGYRVVWANNADEADDQYYSALALLAYAKIWSDWYANSNYMDSYSILAVERMFAYNDPRGRLELSADDLKTLLRFAHFVCYDGSNEYFTNAWDNPTAPNDGNFTSMTMLDPTAAYRDVTNDAPFVDMYSNGTPRMSAGTDKTLGTDFAHTLLKAMTDYVKRHQLSGSRAVERLLSEYGVNLSAEKLNRSIFVGTHSEDVNIGDVTSFANTSQTEVSNLGDYAGRGFAQGSFDFDFTTDEFGIFIAIASILPSAGYYQGIDRNNLHINKLDFFTNEFDNLGVQAIGKQELYVSDNGAYGMCSDYNKVFGYAPRFAEYKVGRSFVTGDFALPASFAGGDSWHLFREMSDDLFDNDIDNQVHSLNFTRGLDYPQYARIFQSTDSDVDKFYLVFHFAVEALAPCKSLFDTYDFEETSKSINIDANGVKVN